MNVIVEDIPQEDKPTENVTTVNSQPNEIEHLAIAERFNITQPTKEENEKLQTIWSYVKQKGGERSIGDIIWEVINLEQTIGAPGLGETRLNKLYKYVRLRMGEARIQEQLKNTVM